MNSKDLLQAFRFTLLIAELIFCTLCLDQLQNPPPLVITVSGLTLSSTRSLFPPIFQLSLSIFSFYFITKKEKVFSQKQIEHFVLRAAP